MESSYWQNAPERFLLGRAYHEIAPVVGWDRAVEIGMLVWGNASPPSKRRGRDSGRRGGWGALYIPQTIDPAGTQKIVALVGIDDARRLAAIFPGEQLQFPCIEAASIARRNRAIAEQVASGEKKDGIAFGFNLTGRQVRRVCAMQRAAQDDREAA